MRSYRNEQKCLACGKEGQFWQVRVEFYVIKCYNRFFSVVMRGILV